MLPSWVTSTAFDKGLAIKTLQDIYRELQQAVVSLPIVELQVRLSRGRKAIANIPTVCKMCPDIVVLPDGSYQIAFARLSSLADQAYRVLVEAGHKLQLRAILQEINHRLMPGVAEDEAKYRSLEQQLVNDKQRFKNIGRSGEWTLAKGPDYAGSIVEAMKHYFYTVNRSATAKEVYDFVKALRPASRRSISIYLSSDANFVRVSEDKYELAEWGAEAYKPATRKKPRNYHRQTLRARVQNETRTFLLKNQEATLESLVKYVITQTKCPRATAYQYIAEMAKSQLLNKEKSGNVVVCSLPSDMPVEVKNPLVIEENDDFIVYNNDVIEVKDNVDYDPENDSWIARGRSHQRLA